MDLNSKDYQCLHIIEHQIINKDAVTNLTCWKSLAETNTLAYLDHSLVMN